MRIFKKQNDIQEKTPYEQLVDSGQKRINTIALELEQKLNSSWLDAKIASVIDRMLAERSLSVVSKMNDKEVQTELVRNEVKSLKNKRARLELAIESIDQVLAEVDVK